MGVGILRADLHLDVGSSHPGTRRRFQGYGGFPFKVIRELGSERREIVQSLSAVTNKTNRRYVLYAKNEAYWPLMYGLSKRA